MAWYAYCIAEQRAFQPGVRVRRPFPVEDLHGIGGAQILAYPSGDFVVIVSEYVSDSTLDQRAILEHAECKRVFSQHDRVAFSFGNNLRE